MTVNKRFFHSSSRFLFIPYYWLCCAGWLPYRVNLPRKGSFCPEAGTATSGCCCLGRMQGLNDLFFRSIPRPSLFVLIWYLKTIYHSIFSPSASRYVSPSPKLTLIIFFPSYCIIRFWIYSVIWWMMKVFIFFTIFSYSSFYIIFLWIYLMTFQV